MNKLLLILGIIVLLTLVGCVEQKKECKYSDDSYLRTYEWIDGWSKNCQKEGKIFTVESDENGTIINPRCALESPT